MSKLDPWQKFQADASFALKDGIERSTKIGIKHEVETRIGRYVNGRFESGVKAAMWNRLLDNLKKYEYPMTNLQIERHTYDKGVRKTVIRGEEDWEIKQPAGSLLPVLGGFMTTFLSTEERNLKTTDPRIRRVLQNFEDTGKIPRTRTGRRFVVQWDEISIIEMTEWRQEPSEIKYEIEIEMSNPRTDFIRRFAAYVTNLKLILTFYLQTNYPFSVETQQNVNALVNEVFGFDTRFYLHLQVLSRARNLKLEDMIAAPGGILDPKVRYELTHKTDGSRKFMVHCRYGLWLIYPPYEYNLISTVPSDNNELYVFDVEVVSKKLFDDKLDGKSFRRMTLIIEPLDTLVYQGRDVREVPNLEERIAMAREYKDSLYKVFPNPESIGVDPMKIPQTNLITEFREAYSREPGIARFIDVLNYRGKGSPFVIHFKPRYPFETVDKFFASVRKIYDSFEAKQLPYEIDGIVVTPINTPYLSDDPENMRSTAHILKWKHQVTIDFEVRRDSGGYRLYYVKEQSREDRDNIAVEKLEFTGTPRHPFNPRKQLIIPDGVIESAVTIAEFVFDPVTKKLVYYRPRPEKSSPNSGKPVFDNWFDMHSSMTLSDMRGETLFFYRKYHNQIKSGLFNYDPKVKTLLDIGSGQGGDIAKWRKYDHIIAVEPVNDERRGEFFKRLRDTDMSDKVTLIYAGGEDWETIVPIVLDKTGGCGVDAISLMDSMTFFWKSDEMYQRLLETISLCLSEDGCIYWKVMDGQSVRQLLRPKFSLDHQDKVIFRGSIDSSYPESDNTQKGMIEVLDWNINEIQFTLPGIVDTQVEYLTNLRQFTHDLDKLGIVAEKMFFADDDSKFIASSYLQLSKLYSYGVFRRQSSLTKSDQNLEIDYRRIVTEIDIPRINSPRRQALSPLRSSADSSTQKVKPIKMSRASSSRASSSMASSGTNFRRRILGDSSDESPDESPDEKPRRPIKTSKATVKTQVKKMMSSIGSDKFEILKTDDEWRTPGQRIARIYAIGDGHCLIHSILQAISPEYQSGIISAPFKVKSGKTTYRKGDLIPDPTLGRRVMAKQLRNDIGAYLESRINGASNEFQQVETYPGQIAVTNWEVMGGGNYLHYHFSQLLASVNDIIAKKNIEKGGVYGYPIDFSLLGLLKLFNSSEWLGDEMFSIISTVLGIDIAALEGYTLDGVKHTRLIGYFTRDITQRNPLCVILHVQGHYETVALVTDNGLLQTVFTANDDETSLYNKIRSSQDTDLPDYLNIYQVLSRNISGKIPFSHEFWLSLLRCISQPKRRGTIYRFDNNPFLHRLLTGWFHDSMERGYFRYMIDERDIRLPIDTKYGLSFYDSVKELTVQAVLERGMKGETLNEAGKKIIKKNVGLATRLLLGTLKTDTPRLNRFEVKMAMEILVAIGIL